MIFTDDTMFGSESFNESQTHELCVFDVVLQNIISTWS